MTESDAPYQDLPSGLKYREIVAGKGGDRPTAKSMVTVHYQGEFENGDVFDSSIERGQPAKFPLNGVIAGWTEGVQLMTQGAKFQFIIPHGLAYGEDGFADVIPPYETLHFEIALLEIH
ncbi:MAG: FKBP-type peptidyl-prolyl cis-trans isomerase [Verrucomicrobiota bacterium]